jgi:hypothetical protein
MITDNPPAMQGTHTEFDNYRRIRKPRVSEPLNAHLIEAFHEREKVTVHRVAKSDALQTTYL